MKLNNQNLHLNLNLKRIFSLPIFFFIIFLIALFINSAREGQCAQVTLTWDPNTESDLAGYKIYSGVQSGSYQRNVDVGNITSYILTGLDLGVTYYIAATAYNTKGLESGFSNEVAYTVPSTSTCSFTITPLNASFSASGGSGTVSITTQTGCNWNTSANISWITVTSGSGTGSGTMRYTVASNTGTSRTASLTIAGNVFTITQAGLSGYVITASAGTGGTISPSGGVSVQSGSSQTFSITPNSGYRIAGVTVDGVSRGSISSYTFSSVNANHTITASFTPNSSPPSTLPPIALTNSATSVTLNSATLNGMVNPNGLSTTYIFQWGRTTSYGNATTVQSVGSGTSSVPVTANLTGLTANRTYRYRLVATNSAGTSYGADQSFITSSNQPSPSSGLKNDFNNDGQTDILWRNRQTGQIAVWYMNGITPIGSVAVADFPYLDWEIAGTGDFNGDGKTDILWRNKQSGQISVLYMNGVAPIGSAVVADFPYLDWEIVDTGDFNSDGQTDILWRNKLIGQISIWYMNGITKTKAVVVADFADLNWVIISR